MSTKISDNVNTNNTINDVDRNDVLSLIQTAVKIITDLLKK